MNSSVEMTEEYLSILEGNAARSLSPSYLLSPPPAASAAKRQTRLSTTSPPTSRPSPCCCSPRCGQELNSTAKFDHRPEQRSEVLTYRVAADVAIIYHRIAIMTPQEVAYTNAFNANRSTLALFSKCSTKDDLHIVRDAFFVGMASMLCPREYGALREAMITDPATFTSIASSINTPDGLQAMVTAARAADGWESLLAALLDVSSAVNSDLDAIWSTLETGRLEWLGALNSAHPLKVVLKDALKKDDKRTERDEMESKMIYLYALSLSIPALEKESEAWRKAIKMEDRANPLKGYNAEMWDPRKEEWRPLDLGVQEAAERGGSSFNDAWEA